MADFVPEPVPRLEEPEDDFIEPTELVQCECWWTPKDEEWGDGERMDYADFDCPVHTRED